MNKRAGTVRGLNAYFRHPVLLAVVIAGAALVLPQNALAGGAKTAQSAKPVPQGYIQNTGQWPGDVRFYTRSAGVDTWVKDGSVVYDFYRLGEAKWNSAHTSFVRSRTGHVLEMKFLDREPTSRAVGIAPQAAEVNYVTANGAHQGDSFGEAKIMRLYNGVDLRIYKDSGLPRFDLLVAPHVDIDKIRFTYEGASRLSKAATGNISIGTSLGDYKLGDLRAFQGQSAVTASFKRNADGTLGFNVGAYDKSKPLVIDPVVYSTLLGGTGADDIASSVTVDQFGQAYVSGFTASAAFPTTSGAYSRDVNSVDIFVTKFNVTASRLLFSTIITSEGPASSTRPLGIVLDSKGRPCITGTTTGGLPTTANAFQKSYGGGALDGFFLRLAADGSKLDYLSYLGGSGDDELFGVGVDKFDNCYVGGFSDGIDYPTTAGSLQPASKGRDDAVVTKITSTNTIGYSTYVGSVGNDQGVGLAVNAEGEVYMAGSTSSPATNPFPTTPGAFLRSAKNNDAFVFKLNAAGNKFIYSTLLGGSNSDTAGHIAVDPSGNAYITGVTFSNDFPISPGAFGTSVFTSQFFATKLALDGSTIVYSTLLNSAGRENAIAVDAQGFLYITGSVAGAAGIATKNPDAAYAGPGDPLRIGDATLQVLNDTGTDLIYGGFWGGSEDDFATGVAVDKSRNAYIVGATNSYSSPTTTEFPTTAGVYRARFPLDDPTTNPATAHWDAFLAKFKVRSQPFLSSVTVNPTIIVGTASGTGTVQLSAPASTTGEAVQLTSSDPGTLQLLDKDGNPTGSTVVFIPGGQTTGSFPIRTSDVVESTTATITANLEGDQRQTAVSVVPWVQALSLNPFTVAGGAISTGRVDLAQPAPAGGMTVSIESSDTNKAEPIDVNTGQPITTVTVAEGLSTVTFNLRTKGVDTPTDVTFLVRSKKPALAGSRTQTLHIVPAQLQSLIISPNVVNGGVKTEGTVSLNGQAGPTAISVKLTLGSGTASVVVPTTVTVPAFSSTVKFPIATGVASSNSFRTIKATRTSTGETVSASVFIQSIEIVNVTPDTTSVLGGTVMKGNVTMSDAVAPGGFTVTVKSTNPTYVKLSAPGSTTLSDTISVTIPAGQVRSPDFTITTVVTKAIQSSTLAVSRTGYASKVAKVTVRPLSATVSLSPAKVVGGVQNSTGTVTINEAAPATGLTFKLSSSSTSAAVVPFSVSVPGGSKSGTFTVTAKAVKTQSSSVIKASIDALPSAIESSATLTVDALGIFVTLNPASITGGASTQATIKLSSPATSDTRVSLSSSSPLAVPPASVLIPAGSAQQTVSVATVPTGEDTAVTLRATLPGGGTNSGKFVVLAPRVQSVTVSPSKIVGGSPTTVKVTLNGKAASGGQAVTLSSNSSAVRVPASLTVPGGATSGSVQVQTNAVANDTNVTITASQPAGHSVTTALTLQAPRLGSLTLNPSAVTGGAPSKGRVSIGTAAPAGGLTVSLSLDPAASGTPYVHIPSTVTIPEGATSVEFNVETDLVSRTVTTQITARFGGNNEVSASLTLNPS